MNTKVTKSGAKVNQARPVETQTLNGRTTGCRDSENVFRIIAPDKMLCPLLLAGMKKGSFCLRDRISTCGESPFETVATKTNQGKIRRIGFGLLP